MKETHETKCLVLRNSRIEDYDTCELTFKTIFLCQLYELQQYAKQNPKDNICSYSRNMHI